MLSTAIIENDGPGRVRYRIQHQSDCLAALRRAELQRQFEWDSLNRKNEVRPQATLDWGVVFEIRTKYGIDALNVKPDQEKRFWQILQTEYPRCLTTNAKVFRPVKAKAR